MTSSSFLLKIEGDARHMVNFFHVFQVLPGFIYISVKSPFSEPEI